MKILKLIAGTFASLLLLSSCEREQALTVEFPYAGDELVLYAYITDSIQYAEVYQTQEVLEQAPEFSVVPTRLDLIENETLLTSFEERQRNYISETILDTLSSFMVQLEAEEKTVISKPILFPKKILVSNYEVQVSSDSSEALVRFSFEDKSGENFYLIKVDKYYQGQIENTFSDLFYQDFYGTFSDEGFSEQTFFYEEELDLSIYLTANGNIVGVEKSDAVSITLYSISKEIYLHYQSVRKNSSSLGGVEETNTPVWTNVEGGHGVVGAYRTDFIYIEL